MVLVAKETPINEIPKEAGPFAIGETVLFMTPSPEPRPEQGIIAGVENGGYKVLWLAVIHVPKENIICRINLVEAVVIK